MLLINKVQLEIKKMLEKESLTEEDYQHLNELREVLVNSLPELNEDINYQEAYYEQVKAAYNTESQNKNRLENGNNNKLLLFAKTLRNLMYILMGVVCIVNITSAVGIYYLILLVLFIFRDRLLDKKMKVGIQEKENNTASKSQECEIASNNLKIYLKRKEITEMFLSLIDEMQKNKVPNVELGNLLALIDEYMLKPSHECQMEKVDGSWQLDDGLNFKLISKN